MLRDKKSRARPVSKILSAMSVTSLRKAEGISVGRGHLSKVKIEVDEEMGLVSGQAAWITCSRRPTARDMESTSSFATASMKSLILSVVCCYQPCLRHGC